MVLVVIIELVSQSHLISWVPNPAAPPITISMSSSTSNSNPKIHWSKLQSKIFRPSHLPFTICFFFFVFRERDPDPVWFLHLWFTLYTPGLWCISNFVSSSMHTLIFSSMHTSLASEVKKLLQNYYVSNGS